MEKRTVYYQDGNTVRKEIRTVPSREEEILYIPETEPEARPQPRRQAKAAPSPAKIGMVVLMTSLTLLFGFLGFTFLSLNSSITTSRSNIYRLEKTLAQLKADNTLTENRLSAQVDLAEVYRVATEELGMVYPDANEQLTYEGELREYVRQYEDIPGK